MKKSQSLFLRMVEWSFELPNSKIVKPLSYVLDVGFGIPFVVKQFVFHQWESWEIAVVIPLAMIVGSHGCEIAELDKRGRLSYERLANPFASQ